MVRVNFRVRNHRRVIMSMRVRVRASVRPAGDHREHEGES